jgi:hypothetical protein
MEFIGIESVTGSQAAYLADRSDGQILLMAGLGNDTQLQIG